MDLYIYSDESGVFDKKHNKLFVFGGVMFLSKEDKDIAARKYKHVERIIRKIENTPKSAEVKATTVARKDSNKIYRSLNKHEKFGVIIRQDAVMDQIFINKKSKQRYLDYAYKICLKRKFENLISNGIIHPNEIKNIHVYADEHTTATNGRYELQQGLEQEFRIGTFNFNYSKFFPPIFPELESLDVHYCNSEKVILIRAADITANKLYRLALQNKECQLKNHNNFNITYLPY